MANLPLTLACADYARVMPLAAGQVAPEGIDLTLVLGRDGSWPMRADLLRQVLADPATHGGESSLGGHLRRIEDGDRSFVGLPIFVLRAFPARDLYVRKDGPVRTAQDLIGKRMGLYSWVASGGVWYRHFQRYLGVGLDAVQWVVGDIEGAGETSHIVTLPPGVQAAPPGRFLAEMLAAGDIDALWSPPTPRLFDAANGPLVRLFPDYRGIEQAYFRDTRMFPPMHLVVVRRAVWDAAPWIGRALVDAFDRSNATFEASQAGFPYATPWLAVDLAEANALMGPGAYSNGLERNAAAMQAFNDQAFDAGITQRRVPMEECFAEFLAAS